MLSNLIEYETLGSPDYFFELFTLLEKSEKTWNKEDIQYYFTNKIIKGEKYFDGTIPLCIDINLLSLNESNQIVLEIDRSKLRNIIVLKKFILDVMFMILKILKNEKKNINFIQHITIQIILCGEVYLYAPLYVQL